MQGDSHKRRRRASDQESQYPLEGFPIIHEAGLMCYLPDDISLS